MYTAQQIEEMRAAANLNNTNNSKESNTMNTATVLVAVENEETKAEARVFEFTLDEVLFYVNRPNRVGFTEPLANRIAARTANPAIQPSDVTGYLTEKEFAVVRKIMSGRLSDKQLAWLTKHNTTVADDATNTQWFFELCLELHSQFTQNHTCGFCRSTKKDIQPVAETKVEVQPKVRALRNRVAGWIATK